MKKLIIIAAALTLTIVSASSVFAAQWRQEENGRWYEYDDGTYPRDKWEQINGIWYYFQSDGYMCTGWAKIGDNYYYFNSDGKMMTNRWIENCYLTADGTMAVNTTVGGFEVGADGKRKIPLTNSDWFFNYWMEINAGKQTDILKFQIQNISGSKIKLLNRKKNYTYSNLDSKYDRKMTLIDDSGNEVDSLIIYPNETRMVYYKLASPTWYDSRKSVMAVEVEREDGEAAVYYCNIFHISVN